MEEQLTYMIEQLGSMEKVVSYFKKSTEEDFRTDLFEIIKINKLTSSMQKKIVDEVEITPEEVRNFFKKIPETELPVFGAELEVSQIVVFYYTVTQNPNSYCFHVFDIRRIFACKSGIGLGG